MAEVIYAPEAECDLSDIAAYIASDNPNAARRWLQTIREKCAVYSTQPLMAEERRGFGVLGCRSFSVGSYVVFFRPNAKGIEIARVLHGSRDLENS